MHGVRYGTLALPDSLLTDAAFVERYRSQFPSGAPDKCWLDAARGGRYRRLQWVFDGRVVHITASRIALALKIGHWPRHLACHHCDQPACVNPEHLYDGTYRDNMLDAIRRGQADYSRQVRPVSKAARAAIANADR